MLVRSVIDYIVHDDADVLLLALSRHAVEVGERSVHGIDILVVRDVVSEIHLRRWVTRTDPDCVDP